VRRDMRIKYVTERSSFLSPCENGLSKSKNLLLKEHPVIIELNPPQGYNMKVQVIIERENPHTFWTNWESSDPTRFSVRIRAAATALYRLNCFGKFEISHYTGKMRVYSLQIDETSNIPSHPLIEKGNEDIKIQKQ